MKLIRASKDQLLFRFGRREKELLLAILKLYPCLPPAHQRLSKGAQLPDQEASQRLLDEALAEHRAENKKQLQALLAEPQRWTEKESGWQLTLASGEVEWLLQVLNDIRVGSWVLLGSPEGRLEAVNAQAVEHLWAMETAGLFQMGFLGAMSGR